jgi:predicted nucleic acid-binding protein
MFLLDTNILSEPVRRAPELLVIEQWNRARPEQLFSSVICLMELRYGAARAVKPGATWSRIEARILSRCTILPFTSEDALRAGEIQATLAASNVTLEWRDVMIAAVAQRAFRACHWA